MNRAEKALPIVILVAGATFAGWAYLSTAADYENKRKLAEAAGFADYSEMQKATAEGISDPKAWTDYKHLQDQKRQAKQEEEAKAEAERARVAAIRADTLAKAAAQAEADRRERLRDPTVKMKVESFSWGKSGFGNVALVTIAIENANEFAVKDISILCSFDAPSGTHLSSVSHVIYDTIKPAATRTFSKVNIGFIHSQAKSASCRVERASRL